MKYSPQLLFLLLILFNQRALTSYAPEKFVKIQVLNPLQSDDDQIFIEPLGLFLRDKPYTTWEKASKQFFKQTKLFSSISCKIEGHRTIDCKLVRKPVIRDFHFSGIPLALLQGELLKQLPIKTGDTISPNKNERLSLVQKLKQRIKSFLEKHGYTSFKQNTHIDIKQDSSARADVYIEISGGEFTVVNDVDIIGNVPISKKRIDRIFKRQCLSFENIVKASTISTFSCYSRDGVNNSIEKLESILNGLGYYQATVYVENKFLQCNFNSKHKKRSCVNLKVFVDKGPKIEISYKFIQGQWMHTNAFTSFFRTIAGVNIFSRLLKAPLGNQRWYNDSTIDITSLNSQLTFKENRIVNPLEIENSKSALKKELEKYGYTNVSIEGAIIFQSPEVIFVEFTITPGTPFYLNQINMIGNDSYSLEILKDGAKISTNSRGIFNSGHFTLEQVKNDASSIQAFYFRNGYVSATVTYQLKRGADNGVELNFYIYEGTQVKSKLSKKILDVPPSKSKKVRGVSLSGNIDTNGGAILREGGLSGSLSSQNYNEIDQGINQIRQSGLFSKVSKRYIDLDESTKWLLLTVSEKKNLTGDIGISFSTDNLFALYLGLNDMNLFGSFLNLNIDSNWGLFWGRQSELGLSLTWPRIWGLPLYFQVRAPYLLYEDNPNRINPERHFQTTASVSLTYQFSEHLAFSLRYLFRLDQWQSFYTNASFYRNPLRSLKTIDGLLDVLKQPYTTRGIITPSVRYSFLDNLFNPKDGINFTVSVELSGKELGADVPYTITNLDVTKYTQISKLTLVTRLKYSRAYITNPRKNWWVLKYQSNMDTLGGDRTVRGYTEGTIGFYGPIIDERGNTTTTLGYHPGNMNLLFNVELRFPISSEVPLGSLDGAVFTDLGIVNICEGAFFNCFSIDQSEDALNQPLGWSIGLGLRYVLPVGPITLDYAISPIKKGDGLFDRMSRVHLMFGYPF